MQWLITQLLIQSAIFGITPTGYGITPAGATGLEIAIDYGDGKNVEIPNCGRASLETHKCGQMLYVVDTNWQ